MTKKQDIFGAVDDWKAKKYFDFGEKIGDAMKDVFIGVATAEEVG